MLVGEETYELAHWLSDAAPAWRALADQVAEHLATLGVAPDGRVRSLAKDIPSNWVPAGWLSADVGRRLVAGRLRVVAGWTQYRRSQAVDPETIRLLDSVCSGLDDWRRRHQLLNEEVIER